ncbi:hypothetical protein UFOVP961_23 [uncultured Caudovirales phage]|uniref:Uncharacterized protein n=1 Tax=uncultured Caudovirales phage TaxID=2100421 RepID=A0A6J5RNC3_9CAUD|nr:hypothetical protein UFOVP961_23 [uncultured Caudovirales phage]CAB4185545.1 hypothetical protein UFOVP1123_93 [uncultured Caudovirales phage]CAB4193304.1 hypothetical protein UFOVP1239_57 [uncultured Caudovirales phage]CAB4216152.1 hypothetical protein UFOVP1484_97 [uncultured Caudovirales phage]CAB5230778.1 hypothetical protein UFOVP1577_103 [uncultured Caudovirales phage]
MLADLLKIISPETLVHAIKSNPAVIQAALQKFDAYVSFGQAMTHDQQVCISNNLNQMSDFFKSESGRDSLAILAEEFQKFLKA